jgi:hypothetical protein
MLTPYTLLLIMTLILFLLGLATFITGILILALRAPGREIQTLATQTTRLAQKGLAQEVSGLVGNASSLMNAVNQLVLTTSGVGAFITILGLLIMGAACFLAFKIFQVQL